MRALVDTGAEVNLIRKGFFPDGIICPETRELKLVTANGKEMEKGKEEVTLKVSFKEEEMTDPPCTPRFQAREAARWCTTATFLLADT